MSDTATKRKTALVGTVDVLISGYLQQSLQVIFGAEVEVERHDGKSRCVLWLRNGDNPGVWMKLEKIRQWVSGFNLGFEHAYKSTRRTVDALAEAYAEQNEG